MVMPVSSSASASNGKILVGILQPPMRTSEETPLKATHKVIELMEQAVLQQQHQQPQQNVAFPDDGNAYDDHDDATAMIRLMLLPELCPIGYSEDSFAKYLPISSEIRNMYQEIDVLFRNAAKKLNCAICYGTIGWKNNDTMASNDTTIPSNNDHSLSSSSSSYFIRQVVIDASGNLIASYDKIHLCDYGDCAETRFFTPGKELVSFQIDGWKFGLLVCADMRYPIQSHRLVKEHGVDVLLQPACFMRDISFRTWKSFRETRAVENGVYYLANNYAGEYFGETSMTPPWVDENHEPIVIGRNVGYLLAQLELNVLQHARTELPFYKHLVGLKCTCCHFNDITST